MAIKGAGAVASYLTGRKNRTPRFSRTAMARRLDTVSREGEINPAMQATIVGQAGRRAGEIAHERKTDLMGRLSSKGFGNSIAGAAALGEPDALTQRIMGETGGRVALANEESKARAANEYARLSDEYGAQRRNERTALVSNLTGGLADAGVSGIEAWEDNELYSDYDEWTKGLNAAQALIMGGDTDAGYELLLRLLDGGEPNRRVPLAPGGRPSGTGDFTRSMIG
jgi:hypothetical protein